MKNNTLQLKYRKRNLFRIISLIFLLIVLRYFYIQIIQHSYFKVESGDNYQHIVKIKPPRGIIYDRNGIELVSNRETFSIEIYPAYYNEEFNVNLFYEMIYSANKRSQLLIDKNQFRESITKKKSNRAYKYKPVLVIDYIDFETRALINENKLDFPGLIFKKNPARFYSDSLRLSHVLGYLRPVSDKDIYPIGDYDKLDNKGKGGIEKEYEELLRGKKGVRIHLVDTYGQDFGIDEDANNTSETPGKDLFLTIDYNLQFKIEKLLKGYKGAVICMNPRNGEVLAMASAPDYSLKEFIGPLKTETWEKWKKENILVNRALRGGYGPASIYKLVAGIMFIEENDIPINEKVFCDGTFRLEDQRKDEGFVIQHCWKEEGHGNVNLHDAITQSCNVYFYDRILKYQDKNKYIIDVLSDYANKLGFNKKTGIVLSERTGNIPNNDYMVRVRGKSWPKRGLMPSLVIGQSDNIVTPIQIINFINLIAMKGKTFKPKLILNEESIPFESKISNYVWNEIQFAMHSVVNDEKGTGFMMKNNNANIYGKTGTLQLTALKQSGYSNQNSLFSGYVEKNGEMMSLVVIIENVDEDSKSISKKISKNIFDYYIENNFSKKGQ